MSYIANVCRITVVLSAITWMSNLAAAEIFEGLQTGLVIEFVVKEPNSDKIYFTGDEAIELDEGTVTKTTRYFTPEKELTQTERSVYRRDDLAPISFEFDNLATGEQAKIDLKKNTAHLSHRATASAAEQTAKIIWTKSHLFGKAFHHKVVRGWDALVAGESLRFDLLVLSRLTTYEFRSQRQRVVSGNPKTSHVLRLEPNSWLIRRFVEPLDFYYYESPQGPLLGKYIGPTTIAIGGKMDTIVKIEFSYKFSSTD